MINLLNSVPTPFASHAFHPVDGYAQSIPYHLFIFLFPLHRKLYLALFVFVNFWTIMIHDGEYMANSPVINGAACHTMHHLYFNYNYGQYTTFWDRLGKSYRKPDADLFEKEKKMGEAVNQRARLRVEGIEHKHKVVYLEKQKAATEEALATCKIDLHAMTSKLRTAQDNLKRANAQTEAAQSREQAGERHIAFLESMVPVEGKEAKRLTDLSNKLEKTMAKSKNARASALHNLTNRRGAVEPLKDVFDDSPAPTRSIGKGPLAAADHVSSITTNYALSLQDKRFGTAVRPASPYLPVNDWSMLTTSSASFVKMHASNLDISEGELLFGSLGTPATTFVQKLPTAESRTHRSMASVSNKTPRATTRRRL